MPRVRWAALPRARTFGMAACALASGCMPSAFDDLREKRPDAGVDAQVGEGGSAEPVAPDGGASDAEAADGSSEEPERDGAAPGALTDGAADAASATPDGSAADAGHGDADTELTLTLTDDADDGVLCQHAVDDPFESLHFDPSAYDPGYALEVGTDFEACHTGLRFVLPLPRGATVTEARLSLLRVGEASFALSGSTMRVQVFDTAAMPRFDHAHVHATPAAHAPLWQAESMGGYHVGPVGMRTESDDLSVLVQHVLDRTDYTPGGALGLLLSPDMMEPNAFAQFRDSFGASGGPSLTLRYR